MTTHDNGAYVKLTKRQGDLLRFLLADADGREIGAIKRAGFSMQTVTALEMRNQIVRDAVTGRMRVRMPTLIMTPWAARTVVLMTTSGLTLMRDSFERVFRLSYARRHEPGSGEWHRERARLALVELRRIKDDHAR